MSLHTRLLALERQRPAADADLAEMVTTVLTTLAEADTPAPERATMLAALREQQHLCVSGGAAGYFVFRRCGADLLIRHYAGVDLDLVTGRTPA